MNSATNNYCQDGQQASVVGQTRLTDYNSLAYNSHDCCQSCGQAMPCKCFNQHQTQTRETSIIHYISDFDSNSLINNGSLRAPTTTTTTATTTNTNYNDCMMQQNTQDNQYEQRNQFLQQHQQSSQLSASQPMISNSRTNSNNLMTTTYNNNNHHHNYTYNDDCLEKSNVALESGLENRLQPIFAEQSGTKQYQSKILDNYNNNNNNNIDISDQHDDHNGFSDQNLTLNSGLESQQTYLHDSYTNQQIIDQHDLSYTNEAFYSIPSSNLNGYANYRELNPIQYNSNQQHAQSNSYETNMINNHNQGRQQHHNQQQSTAEIVTNTNNNQNLHDLQLNNDDQHQYHIVELHQNSQQQQQANNKAQSQHAILNSTSKIQQTDRRLPQYENAINILNCDQRQYSHQSSTTFLQPPTNQIVINVNNKRSIKRGRGRPRIRGSGTGNKVNGKLWEFIRDLLLSERTNPSFIRWERREDGVFKFVQSDKVAKMWGERKQNPKMTYEKLSRAMRYYYKSKVLLPVFGRRLVYKFGPNATGWLPTT